MRLAHREIRAARTGARAAHQIGEIELRHKRLPLLHRVVFSKRVADELAKSTWRQWVLDWNAPKGNHIVAVRATDGTGETQTAKESPPDPDGATGYHTIQVKVS